MNVTTVVIGLGSKHSKGEGEEEFLRAQIPPPPLCRVEGFCHMTLSQSEGGKAVGVAGLYDAHVLSSHRYGISNYLSRPEKVSELNGLVWIVEKS